MIAKRLILTCSIIFLVANCTSKQGDKDSTPAVVVDPDLPKTNTVNLDGKSFRLTSYSLDGVPRNPQAGDIIDLGIMLKLNENNIIRFKTVIESSVAWKLYREDSSGNEHLIGLSVHADYVHDKPVYSDPLSTITDEELRGLWGLDLGVWNHSTNKRLQLLDTDRTCLTVDLTIYDKHNHIPINIPPTVKYLSLKHGGSRSPQPILTHDLDSLRFLQVTGFAPFDVKWIKQYRTLKYLDLRFTIVKNIEHISSLSSLRYLDLSGHREMSNLTPLKDLKYLRGLNIEYSNVTDLTGLAALKQLEWVDAGFTPSTTLPLEKIPSLRHLRILSTQIPEQTIDEFTAKNPQCKVYHHWKQMLLAAVSDSTRIRIRKAMPEQHIILATEDNPSTIDELIDNISIDESASSRACGCEGNLYFDFMWTDQVVATLSYHHGKALRWREYWPADAVLTQKSATFITKWLEDHGIKDIK